MKTLFLSDKGDSFPLAHEMLLEGHDIKFYTKDPKEKRAGQGFVPIVSSYLEYLEWADLVISDDTTWGSVNETLRDSGVPVIGGTVLTDKMEEDRDVGQKMFEALEMHVLPSQKFTDMAQAISYVVENPSKYVVKVSGKAQDDKTLTYVGQMEDGSDIPKILEHYQKRMGADISSVQVQEAAEGTEVAIGGWFNGKDFLDPVLINFEHKKLMPSKFHQAGIGPATGEMGTIGYWKDKGFDLYNETLERFISVLRQTGYHGYFDINCIVHPYIGVEPNEPFHIHPLEMTTRFGWPTILMQIEAMEIQDLGDLFLKIAKGTAEDFKVKDTYCGCVVIGVPPLPYIDAKIAEKMSNGLPILFRDPTQMDGVYFGDAIVDNGEYVCQGIKGYAVVCCASANDIREVQNKMYAKVQNIIIPNAMYREDIGDLIPIHVGMLKPLLKHSIEEVSIELPAT